MDDLCPKQAQLPPLAVRVAVPRKDAAVARIAAGVEPPENDMTRSKHSASPGGTDRPSTLRTLRLIAWNLSLAAVGAATAAVIGEAYLRATKPFMTPSYPWVNVPGVGTMFEPGSVVRHTNKLDFWTTTPVNRWGFADREPMPTARTEESCHIAVVGDSFVEALEVPIAAKMHVQLEQLAASELPHLDVTTSAFGRSDTGQAAQLAYYDKYAARLKPKLVVIVFNKTDFGDNYYGPKWRPNIVEAADGTLKLLPPDPESMPFHPRGRRSYLLAWLDAKHIKLRRSAAAALHRRTIAGYAPPENLHAVRFALQQFAIRVQRDNASLVILSEHLSHVDRAVPLRSAAGDIPVVAFHDYMVARGRTSKDRRWDHDYHWNPDGHRWAAQAVLEYLRANQHICRQGVRGLPGALVPAAHDRQRGQQSADGGGVDDSAPDRHNS